MFLLFVAVRSFTADSSLLQPTGWCEQHTSHVKFSRVSPHYLHAHAWLKSSVWRGHITFHVSSSCADVVVLALPDFSTFLSLLSIFSLIILSFLLAINFICQVPCALQPVRTLALLPSTTLSQTLLLMNKDNGLTLKYRNPKDHYCFQVSKFITRLLRHSQKVYREEDGGVHCDQVIDECKTMQSDNTGYWSDEMKKHFVNAPHWSIEKWTEENISILLEFELSSLFPVPSSNPRTFRKYNQSCIARQCIVIRRFYRVYLSRRKRKRIEVNSFTLFDSRRSQSQNRRTSCVPHCCKSDGLSRKLR